MTFTDVMKLAFFRLLQSCGIDPKKHVEIQDESKETKKMMSRGLTSVEGAWERFFNTIPEIDRQGTTTDSAVAAQNKMSFGSAGLNLPHLSSP